MKKVIKISILIFVFALSFVSFAGAQINAGVKLDTDIKVDSNNTKLDADAKSDTSINEENDNEDSLKKDESELDDNEDTDGSISFEHRSRVATYVKGLLDISTKDKSIGTEVKLIAKSQDDDSLKGEDAVKKISSRSKFRTFLFGSDYKNLGVLRSLMVKTDNEIKQLTSLAEKAQTPAIKAQLEAQITLMKAEQVKIAAFIKTYEGKFSLFGWMRSK